VVGFGALSEASNLLAVATMQNLGAAGELMFREQCVLLQQCGGHKGPYVTSISMFAQPQ
jgi:hypothetical protein